MLFELLSTQADHFNGYYKNFLDFRISRFPVSLNNAYEINHYYIQPTKPSALFLPQNRLFLPLFWLVIFFLRR